jgi:hypothetical protein
MLFISMWADRSSTSCALTSEENEEITNEDSKDNITQRRTNEAKKEWTRRNAAFTSNIAGGRWEFFRFNRS